MTAAIATVCTCVVALVLPRAARIRAGRGMDAVDWSLGVYYAATALALLGLVAGFVTGSMWLDRARKNAEVLAPDGRHTRRAGWAWGGWVTPFVALWFPFQVVRDVRRALSPMETSALIGFWWALFLASEIGVRTSLNLQGDALVRLENAADARQWSIITAAVMIAALAGGGRCCARSPSSSTSGCTAPEQRLRTSRSRTAPSPGSRPARRPAGRRCSSR